MRYHVTVLAVWFLSGVALLSRHEYTVSQVGTRPVKMCCYDVIFFFNYTKSLLIQAVVCKLRVDFTKIVMYRSFFFFVSRNAVPSTAPKSNGVSCPDNVTVNGMNSDTELWKRLQPP